MALAHDRGGFYAIVKDQFVSHSYRCVRLCVFFYMKFVARKRGVIDNVVEKSKCSLGPSPDLPVQQIRRHKTHPYQQILLEYAPSYVSPLNILPQITTISSKEHN